jgi:hypothetical protein
MKQHMKQHMKQRFGIFLLITVCFGVGLLLTEVRGQDPSPVTYPAPRISAITPDSCLVHWDPYTQADFSTHYQVRLNTFLFGSSTQQTTMAVGHLIPGNTNKIDYVIYHQGKILGISSSTSMLMAPATPSSLFADQISTTSFRLTWLSVPTATEYAIYTNEVLHSEVTAPHVQTTLTGFLPGEVIRVQVAARNPSGLSYFSRALLVRLLPPPPQLTVDVTKIGQTSFTASWQLLSDIATYTIFKDGTEHKSVGSQTNQVLVEECVPGATVTVKLKAFNSTGGSEFSPEVIVLTIPATPLRPIAYNIATNSFTLEWIAVTGTRGYKIYRDQFWLLYNVPVGQTSVLCARGFNPGEIASMTVTTYNDTGESPFSDTLTVQLLSLPTAPLTAALSPLSPRIWSIPDFRPTREVLEAFSQQPWWAKETPMVTAIFSLAEPDFHRNLEKWLAAAQKAGSSGLQFVTLVVVPRGVPFPEGLPITATNRMHLVFLHENQKESERIAAGLFIFARPGHLRLQEMGTLWLENLADVLQTALPDLPNSTLPDGDHRQRFQQLHSPATP